MPDLTRILSQIESGDPKAAEQLLPLVYEELRQLAAAKLAREKPGGTLQATELVHEAYLRLVSGEQGERSWDNRGHFFSAAAECMRRVLVDVARQRRSLKRGGDVARHDFEGLELPCSELPEDLVALDAALKRLALVDPVAAKLVELRFFAGLTLAEIAELLGVSPRTADRIWSYARAWLHQEIRGTSPSS